MTHGLFAYEATLKVPLVVWCPGRVQSGRTAQQVRHVDILPTVLELVGLPPAAGLPGRSLLAPRREEATYFESLSASLNRGWAPLTGVIAEGLKYVDLPIPELYDLKTDPQEKRNLVAERPDAIRRLKALLPSSTSAAVPRATVIVEIPGDRLLASHDSPNMNVDVFVYAIDRQGRTHDYLVQPIGIELSKAAAALAKDGIKYYGLLTLAPGDYTLRTLVRDNETGRFGVSVTPVKVPAGSEPLALPPLLLEEGRQWIMVKGKPRNEADAAAEYPFAISGDSFVPTALAGIKNGEKTRVCLIAYNFPPAAEAIGYTGRILGVDGQQHGKMDLKLLKASDGERESARKLLLEFRPSGLDPGRYALIVKLQDGRTGKTSESSATFDVP